MKILIIVPDGVGIRNYLYSNFIEELEKKDVEVVLYYQVSDDAISEIKKYKKSIKDYKRIPLFIESIAARILRESLAYARLKRNTLLLNNKTIMSFWNKKPIGVKQKGLYFIVKLLGSIFSKSKSLLLRGDKLHNNIVLKNKAIIKIENDFDSIKPDLVLNLHQRAPISTPIISVAKKNKIKTATIIFSWDNVPKARLISRYDIYFVWSQIMKEQLELLYEEINSSQIKIVGTPQFEFYEQSKFYIEKAEFFKIHGLDINKKIICYSANDKSFPYDPNYLNDICSELMKLDEKERPQILFRQCPVDLSDRFNDVINKYNTIIKPVKPLWEAGTSDKKSFATVYPKYTDIGLLVNTVLHSDLAINVGSTIAHDFSALNKPTLYLNYNVENTPVVDVDTIYKYEHFKSMKNLKAVGWINGKVEINDIVQEALTNPKKIAIDRLKWFDSVIAFKNESSAKLANEITNL